MFLLISGRHVGAHPDGSIVGLNRVDLIKNLALSQVNTSNIYRYYLPVKVVGISLSISLNIRGKLVSNRNSVINLR